MRMSESSRLVNIAAMGYVLELFCSFICVVYCLLRSSAIKSFTI